MKARLLWFTFALTCIFAACAPHANAPPTPAAPHRLGGVFGSSSGGGGSPPPSGTGFVTVTNGSQDGTALAYPLSEANGGTGATSFPGPKGTSLVFSLADYGQARAFTWLASADYTVGIKFLSMTSGVAVKGVRFYYDDASHTARTIKVSLVDVTGTANIESVTSSSLAAGAVYEVDFVSTHTMTPFNAYAVAVYAASGTHVAAFDSGSGLGPGLAGTAGSSFVPTMIPWRLDGHVYFPPTTAILYTGTDDPAHVGSNPEPLYNRIVPIEPVFSQ